LPGLVDGHTHPVWAGDRVGEFAMKLAGATYMQVGYQMRYPAVSIAELDRQGRVASGCQFARTIKKSNGRQELTIFKIEIHII
jgi:imidazolonepropionase-like amidohydrolase